MNTNAQSGQQLLIDMVAFTYFIAEQDRMAIVNMANSRVFQMLYQCFPQRKNNAKMARYKNDYGIKFAKDTQVKLSLYPINKSHRFVRLEFNPEKLGWVGRIVLRRMLVELLGRDAVLRLYFEAVVTRLDLTLDIFDMERALYVHRDRVCHSEVFRDAETGEMSSQIVGSKDSNIRIILYNKDAEQGTSTIARNYQRIEVNYKHLNCSMDQLEPSLADIFMSLNFFRNSFLKDRRMTKAFRKDAYSNGLNNALNKLPKADKDQYLEYLEDYRANPIDQKALRFELAHYRALKFLVHKDFRGTEVRAQRSLIKNTHLPSKHWMPSVGYFTPAFRKEFAEVIKRSRQKQRKRIRL
ncbi:MAG: replication initiation factor domain-containing protein [Methylomonas sp.]|jgi:hypothetical protein|uniref:hypothetical protein n=1 Tax=Methylomonas sp. TaxID=418 RepID=UPI0025EA05FE|nr:hypothetical protein [Methylomonas sp.]MCK9608677.1 replication initiation factor domain-containing protein [Methylomonas sp.]